MNVIDRGILWHHFGRGTGGYVTLASSSRLPEGIAKKLERFAWGQPRRASPTGAASPDPGLWIEPIGSFVAITRISTGLPDRSERATLSFFTLLPTREQYVEEVLPNLEAILREPGNWMDPGRDTIDVVGLGRKPTALPEGTSDLVHRLLAVTAANPSTSIVLPAASLRIDQVVEFLRALPANQVAEFRVAYRALSDAIVADLVVPDLDYSPEKAARKRVVLSGDALEGSQRIEEATHDRLSSFSHRSSGFDAAIRGSQRWHPPEESELEMTKTTVAVLAVVAGMVLVFGVANLWLFARHAEDAAVSALHQSMQVRSDIEASSVSIKKNYSEWATEHAESIRSLKTSMVAHDRKIEAAHADLQMLAGKLELMQAEYSTLEKQIEKMGGGIVSFTRLNDRLVRELCLLRARVFGTAVLARVTKLFRVTFGKSLNGAMGPQRSPAGVAIKTTVMPKEKVR